MQKSGKILQGVKYCPKCSGEMGLLWKDRKRSENAYASERMHFILCMTCGYGRTERFINNTYPIILSYAPDGRLITKIVEGKDILTRPIDATTIAASE
ncbi:MAG: hypothetical protein OEV78_01725 [Spirochaetia bacterium]|nr:hypothetical protein [Spirochaetia bacterium]